MSTVPAPATQVQKSSANEERFRIGFVGVPQIIAGFLLLALLGQCAYFVAHVPLTQVEVEHVLQGAAALQRLDSSVNQLRSPLVGLISVAGIAPSVIANPNVVTDQFWLDSHRWYIRAPFLMIGLALAASLWFVARRLFANQGGYIALGLYAFSPMVIARSSLAGPEIVAAWGGFGLIFTAIATAHTLYAPREVVLWNWKRILILGISIALAVGAQWSMVIVLIPALAFMLWAVPQRRGATLAIFGAGLAIALVLLDLVYGGSPRAFLQGMLHARWFDVSLVNAANFRLYPMFGSFYLNGSPAGVVTFIVALVTFFSWKRARFFGNAAPLIVFALLVAGALLFAHSGGPMFLFYALPFAFLFSAGVFADLFETQSPGVALGTGYGSILAQVVYSVAGLMRLFSRGA